MRLLAVSLLMAVGALLGHATAGSVQDEPDAGKQKLTVWRVLPVGPARQVSIASLAPVVRSQTAGGFGQTSGSFGNTASSTGQTAGSLGQTAGSAGQTAGSTGQTAGSFGEALDTIADAAEVSNGTLVSAPIGAAAAASVTGTTGGTRSARAGGDPEWERFTEETKSGFVVTFADVGVAELRERLAAVEGKEEAPDVLVTVGRPKGWLWRETGLTSHDALQTVGKIEPIPRSETQAIQGDRNSNVEAAIMTRAPHPQTARAFVLRLLDVRRNRRTDILVPENMQDPVAVAKSALTSVLSGGEVGASADREMARFNPAVARRMALLPDSHDPLGTMKIEVNTISAGANDRFAVVALRAVMEGPTNFGVAHAVVVLRMSPAGQWKVLQLTPNLTVDELDEAVRELGEFTATVQRSAVERLQSVELAAPVDGDNRPPVPEFWWENPGGGELQIVEWQRTLERSWTGSNLYFVPGDNGHLRTRATGRFADAPGSYRWRVWSLGRGGTVAISGWRSVNILAR